MNKRNSMELRSHQRRRGGFKKFLFTLILILLIAFAVFFGFTYLEGIPPTASIHGGTGYVGTKAVISIQAADQKTGLKSIRLVLKQDGREHLLYEKQFPRKSYTGMIGEPSLQEAIAINTETLKLKEGPASITLHVTDYALRHGLSGNTTEVSSEFVVDTKAPIITVLHTERYIGAGQSGIVIYHVEGDPIEKGVNIAGHFHPGFPLAADRKNDYISYIGLPCTATSVTDAIIRAVDKAGNTSEVPIYPTFTKVVQANDKILIDDNFLKTKIPEFEQHVPVSEGTGLEKYLEINREIRKKNNMQIAEICSHSGSERLWKGRFLRMPGAVKAGFADHRTYYYNGKEIDRQTHLGIDIASVAHAEVRAANRGKVIYADYLGIYGNMIIIDHGQGIFSLYSHLSRIQARVGDLVGKDAPIALSGKTGMAGGDHLHFSILINGIFVTPKEWWDRHWVEATIDTPIANSRF